MDLAETVRAIAEGFAPVDRSEWPPDRAKAPYSWLAHRTAAENAQWEKLSTADTANVILFEDHCNG